MRSGAAPEAGESHLTRGAPGNLLGATGGQRCLHVHREIELSKNKTVSAVPAEAGQSAGRTAKDGLRHQWRVRPGHSAWSEERGVHKGR